MRSVQFTDGRLTMVVIEYQELHMADLELWLKGNDGLAPHKLDIAEAESLINLLRQAIAQAREFENNASRQSRTT